MRILLSLVLCSLVACGGNSRPPVEDRAPPSQSSSYSVKSGDTLYSIAFRYGLDYRKVAAANAIGPPYTIYPGQSIRLDESTAPGIVAVPTKVAAVPPLRPPVPVYAPVRGAGPSSSAPARPLVTPPTAPPTTPSPTLSSTPPTTPPTTPGIAPSAQAETAPIRPPIATTKPEAVTDNYVGAKVGSWLWPTSGPVTRGFSESVHKGIDIGGARGDPVVAVAAGKVVYAGTGIVGFGELLIVKHNEVYLSAYGHNDRLLVAEGQTVVAGQTIAEKGSSGTDTVKLHFEVRQEGKPIDPQRVLPRR